MGIYSVGYITRGVPQNFSFRIFVGICIVEQCGECVPGIMWCMHFAADAFHDPLPDDRAIPGVLVWPSGRIADKIRPGHGHSVNDDWQNPRVNGDDTDARGCFCMGNA